MLPIMLVESFESVLHGIGDGINVVFEGVLTVIAFIVDD